MIFQVSINSCVTIFLKNKPKSLSNHYLSESAFIEAIMHPEHENKKVKAERLIEAMGRLIIMMQEVNDTCLRLSEDISKKDLMKRCILN